MIAIKDWFLKKQGFNALEIKELRNCGISVQKETEKAVLLKIEYFIYGAERELWVPKSCLIDEWERKITPLDYHDYLVNTAVRAYKDGYIPQKLIEHKRIRKGTSYVAYVDHESEYYHTYRSAELKHLLDKYNVEYMTYEEFKKGRKK